MGNLKVSHNFTGETGHIIAVWKKSTVPLTEVGRQEYPAPHSQESLLIEDLDNAWYFIKFWRSADGVTLDEDILTLAGNAADGSIYGTERFEYVVNRGLSGLTPPWSDPTSGNSQLRDERLFNGVYEVEIRGIGTMSVTEFNDRSDDGGGFDMVDGTIWEDGQKIFVTLAIPQAAAVGPSASGGGEVSDIVVMDDNLDYDPATHNGKLIIVDCVVPVVRFSIPNLASLPNSFFKLQTHSLAGTQRNCGIQFDAGDTIDFLNLSRNVIWMGRGEEISVLVKDNVVYVVQYNGDYRRVGERRLGDKLEQNDMFLDGTQYNQADVPRLMELVDALPGSMVIAEGAGAGQWSQVVVINGENVFPNKGKFARVDTGTPKIRVPDDRDITYKALQSVVLDAVDAENITNNPGGYQHFKTSMKGVTIGLRDGGGGSSTGTLQGTGFSGQDAYGVWFNNTTAGNPNQIRFNNVAEGFAGKDETRSASRRLLPIIKI